MIVLMKPCCDGDRRVSLSMTSTEAEMLTGELRFSARSKVTDRAYRLLARVCEPPKTPGKK